MTHSELQDANNQELAKHLRSMMTYLIDELESRLERRDYRNLYVVQRAAEIERCAEQLRYLTAIREPEEGEDPTGPTIRKRLSVEAYRPNK